MESKVFLENKFKIEISNFAIESSEELDKIVLEIVKEMRQDKFDEISEEAVILNREICFGFHNGLRYVNKKELSNHYSLDEQDNNTKKSTMSLFYNGIMDIKPTFYSNFNKYHKGFSPMIVVVLQYDIQFYIGKLGK